MFKTYFNLVVIQSYEAEADNEYVIRGNAAIMKCEIPSYVADFVYVDFWSDSEGHNYYPNAEEIGIYFLSTLNVILYSISRIYFINYFFS